MLWIEAERRELVSHNRDNHLHNSPERCGYRCPCGHSCGPSRTLSGIELLVGEGSRVIHLTLRECLLESLAGGLKVRLGLSPQLLFLLGVLSISAKKLALGECHSASLVRHLARDPRREFELSLGHCSKFVGDVCEL